MRSTLSFAVLLAVCLVLPTESANAEVISTIINGDYTTTEFTHIVAPGGVTGNLVAPKGVDINEGTTFGLASGGGNISLGGTTNIRGGVIRGNVTIGDVTIGTTSFLNVIGGTFGTPGAGTGNLTATNEGQAVVRGGTFHGRLIGRVRRFELPTGFAAEQVAVADPEPGSIVWDGGTVEAGLLFELELAPAALLGESSSLFAAAADDVPGMPITIIGRGLFLETETDNFTSPEFPGRVFTYSALSGTLADGTVLRNLTVLVERGIAPNITLVQAPEPTAFALAAIAFLGLVAGRRCWR